MATKPRIHSEYFRSLVKTTCECGAKKTLVYAWGEYHRARWNTILHFCQECFQERVQGRLTSHAGDCGCSFQLQAYRGAKLPEWIKVPAQLN